MIYAASIFASVAIFTASTVSASKPFAFVGIGDWGGAAVSSQDYTNVYTVANQMATTASDIEAKFVMAVGDNFYWCGIQ